MLPTERIAYSPINNRPRLALPGGARLAVWVLDVFDRFRIPAALAINGGTIQVYERADIAKTTEVIQAFTGRRPRGWLGPGLTETWDTPDILVEEGYEYVCDWVLDDQPVTLKTRSQSLVSVPYTQECNDVAMMLIQHHKATEYRDRAIDQFEQLYSDAHDSARIMAVVVHPYIMGAPHRLRYFREALEHIQSCSGVLFWTGAQILDWYLGARVQSEAVAR